MLSHIGPRNYFLRETVQPSLLCCYKAGLNRQQIQPCISEHNGTDILFSPGFGLAWINATYPPKPLYHSPSSAGQGRRNMMKGSRVETRTGRDHSPITVRDKTDWTWGEKGA